MPPIITDLNNFPPNLLGAAVAIGNFDGVHQGHARLINQLVKLANSAGGPAIVLTFDPPPQAILVPERTLSPPLTPITRRAELLAALGVDALIAYPTDLNLLTLSARDFFQQIIIDRLHAGAMVEGPNFRFGRDRAGDTQLLRELCQAAGMKFQIAEATVDTVGMISSSRIRSLLANGNIAAANQMLTQSYQLTGLVSDGAQRGRQLGFPTANLTAIESQIPAHGVYAGSVTLDNHRFPAAINIGPNPTFDEINTKVEVHIVGWSGSLYGQTTTCTLSTKIRDIIRFDSLTSLQDQIRRDIAAVVGSDL